MTVLMQASAITRHYPAGGGIFAKKGLVKAVDGVDFTLREGETLAVVGESGCGKSTLARVATLIEPPTAGELRIDGNIVADDAARARLRLSVQMVFQNPYGSLNPRKKIGAILEAPLAISTDLSPAEQADRARAMLTKVGLPPENMCGYRA